MENLMMFFTSVPFLFIMNLLFLFIVKVIDNILGTSKNNNFTTQLKIDLVTIGKNLKKINHYLHRGAN